MDIIPVIDLKGGSVVRAARGERALYRPIESPLSATSDPVDVARGLLGLCSFKTLYIADLDAIEGRGDAGEAIRRIASALPALRLWVDNGCAEGDRARAFLAAHPDAHLVLGSESQNDAALVESLGGEPRVLLSLDFRGESFQGPQDLLARSEFWPERVIVMTLARVGSNAGPDVARLSEIIARAGGRRVYAAGGVRGRDDLDALRGIGASGVLVASALHDGRLGPAGLRCGTN